MSIKWKTAGTMLAIGVAVNVCNNDTPSGNRSDADMLYQEKRESIINIFNNGLRQKEQLISGTGCEILLLGTPEKIDGLLQCEGEEKIKINTLRNGKSSPFVTTIEEIGIKNGYLDPKSGCMKVRENDGTITHGPDCENIGILFKPEGVELIRM